MPHCWKSHDVAQVFLQQGQYHASGNRHIICYKVATIGPTAKRLSGGLIVARDCKLTGYMDNFRIKYCDNKLTTSVYEWHNVKL